MASSANVPMCKNCNTRSVYVEPTGRVHDFCGKRCMSIFQKQGVQVSVQSAPTPVTTSTSGGDTLGLGAIASNMPGAFPPTTTSTGSATTAVSSAVDASPSRNPRCALSNCRREAHPGSQYCGQKHRQEAVVLGEAEGCLFCAKQPKATINNKLSDFCSRRCGQDAIASAPIILALDSKSALYDDVANQFTTKWKHTTVPPTVHKVWKIFSKKTITDRFWQYKLDVERRTSLQGGNSKRRFHGTSRTCNLGNDDKSRDFCQNPGCSVCRIIETSFQLTRVGQATNFGRFGTGIYTSSTSSKADSYVREQGGSRYKSMLLSDVVMGKTKKLTQSDTSLTKPPAGHDSVVGEPGGDLNYDEAIVYQNEAIRPLFLIIYS